jgi:hypothetical protein
MKIVMENKLYDFINFIAWPSYKLSKDEAQKYHREFLSFCFDLGDGKIIASENPNQILKKDMISDLEKMREWRDVYSGERERLNALEEPDNEAYITAFKYNRMMKHTYTINHLEPLGIALAVIGHPEKDPFAILRYGILIAKADEILGKITKNRINN